MLIKVCLLCFLALCFCAWFFAKRLQDQPARQDHFAGGGIFEVFGAASQARKHACERAATLNGLWKRGGKAG